MMNFQSQIKGVPAQESRMKGQLVSPAKGGEKKIEHSVKSLVFKGLVWSGLSPLRGLD